MNLTRTLAIVAVLVLLWLIVAGVWCQAPATSIEHLLPDAASVAPALVPDIKPEPGPAVVVPVQVIVEQPKTRFILWSASWCGACPQMKATCEQFPAIEVHDCDTEGQVFAAWNIPAIPCLQSVRDGRELDRLVGYHDAEAVKAWIAKQEAKRD